MSQDRAWSLLEEGEAKQAVEVLDRLIRSEAVTKVSWLANRGLALAALGDFAAAAESFGDADRIALRSKPPTGIRYLLKIAQLQWLAGERIKALATSKDDVDLIARRKTAYTDFAGGVSNGLFLLFVARSLGDDAAFEIARDFLRRLSTDRARFTAWPGPIGSFVLGESSLEEVLTSASGFGDLKWAVHKTKSDVAARRKVTQALFYTGAHCRFQGLASRSQELISACGEVPNPLIELEWYIARAESGT